MPAPVKTLLQVRTQAREFADMENSNFCSDSEIDTYINLGIKALYSLIAQSSSQEFLLATTSFAVAAPTQVYDLPDNFSLLKGVTFSRSALPTVLSGTFPTQTTHGVPFEEFADDAVPLLPYMFDERHTRQSVEHMDYRLYESKMRYRVFTETTTNSEAVVSYVHRIRFQPIEAGNIMVWYLPAAPTLAIDADDWIPFHGFDEFPALYAAKRMLAKEETDPSWINEMLSVLTAQIQSITAARDVGHPGRVQDVTYGDY